MTRAEMLSELREVIDDLMTPYAWPDPLLLGYLSEGQDVFCEDTGLFIDKTNYTIELVDGVQSYALDDRIIEVLSVHDGARRLGKSSTVDAYYPSGPEVSVSSPSAPGLPARWRADEETGELVFDRTPSSTEAGTVLTLKVWRYSRTPLDGEDAAGDDGVPELPRTLQRGGIEWAAYKAYMHHDEEQQDPVKAADHLAAYKRYVLRGKQFLRRRMGTDVKIESNPAYMV